MGALIVIWFDMIHSSTPVFGRHEQLCNEDFIFREFPESLFHQLSETVFRENYLILIEEWQNFLNELFLIRRY